MMNLFYSFDLNFFNLKYIFLIIFISSMVKALKNSLMEETLKMIMNVLKSMLSTNFKEGVGKIYPLHFILTFLVIFTMNFSSIFPYNFSFTTNIGMVMAFALVCWGASVKFMIKKNYKSFVVHLVPQGAPLPMVIFLVLIELVSSFIRPLTLSIRLSANILTGHLILSLISMLVFNFKFMFIFYSGFVLVELAVSLIQAYIFATLSSLYHSEIS